MLIEMISEGVAWFKDVSNSSVACYNIVVKK
jgi:catabolite regulation protein CreA